MEKLKILPCPLCGFELLLRNDPESRYIAKYGPYYAHPPNSSCVIADIEIREEDVDKWNKRV